MSQAGSLFVDLSTQFVYRQYKAVSNLHNRTTVWYYRLQILLSKDISRFLYTQIGLMQKGKILGNTPITAQASFWFYF